MPGAGTKVAITTGSPPARLLDITRLMSRAGRGLTGIDRVERAWLAELLTGPVPLWLIGRTAFGYVLLDRAGGAQVLAAVDEGDWGRPDRLSRLARRATVGQRAAQSFVRARAAHRCLPQGLSRMLRALPEGTAYINVGHSNLTRRMLRAAKRRGPVTVMVHDTIPLDWPEMQREGTVAGFEGKLRRVSALADRVICSTGAVAADVSRHLVAMGRVPPITVAALGVTLAAPRPDELAGLPLDQPYFVALGTIEPRKNIGLLLDVWEGLGPNPPRLILCGARGWHNEEVFARLDAGVDGVTEVAGLSDGAVTALLAGARALLFPSLAEGYGLPPLEAAALGRPVLCNALAICRELLGTRAVYADGTDVYQWRKIISDWTGSAPPATRPPFDPPSWADHFKTVLGVT